VGTNRIESSGGHLRTLEGGIWCDETWGAFCAPERTLVVQGGFGCI